MTMKVKRGQRNTPAGEAHHGSRLTEQQVRDLRQLVADGICVCCAQKFLKLTCSYSTAWDAANYTTWRHVK